MDICNWFLNRFKFENEKLGTYQLEHSFSIQQNPGYVGVNFTSSLWQFFRFSNLQHILACRVVGSYQLHMFPRAFAQFGCLGEAMDLRDHWIFVNLLYRSLWPWAVSSRCLHCPRIPTLNSPWQVATQGSGPTSWLSYLLLYPFPGTFLQCGRFRGVMGLAHSLFFRK